MLLASDSAISNIWFMSLSNNLCYFYTCFFWLTTQLPHDWIGRWKNTLDIQIDEMILEYCFYLNILKNLSIYEILCFHIKLLRFLEIFIKNPNQMILQKSSWNTCFLGKYIVSCIVTDNIQSLRLKQLITNQ